MSRGSRREETILAALLSKWDGVPFDEAVNSPDWQGFGWICPVCGNHNAGEYPDSDVCLLCGWEDDHLQRDDPDYSGGANRKSLNEYRANWERS